MAGPFQNTQVPSLQEPAISRSASPLVPSPTAGQPISFKTNVNRAKSKRWVEAKSYSYDGNDWGDDDDYDEDEDEEPPVPQLPSWREPSQNSSTRNLGSSAPSSEVPALGRERTRSPNLGDKSTSPTPDNRVFPMGQNAPQLQQQTQLFENSEIQHGDPSPLAMRPVASSSIGGADASTNKPLPFIRPADIYKRMQEEKEKEKETWSQESTKPSVDSADVEHPTVRSALDTEHKQSLESKQSATSTSPQDVPGVPLPEVKRVAGVDDNLSGISNSDNSGELNAPNEADTQQHSLHHNPSLGFVSAVNQAFDAPSTPSSTVGSVVRSGSESTSVISPILGARGLEAEKTPTITEEPGESSDGRRTPTFRPGHRRDLSTPTPDNSPARRPVVSENQAVPPESGEMSSTAHEASQHHEKAFPEAPPAGLESKDTLESALAPDSSEIDATNISESPVNNESLSTDSYNLGHSASATGNAEDNGDQLGGNAHYDKAPTPLRIRSGQYFDQDEGTSIPHLLPPISTETSPKETSPQDTESDRLRKEIMRRLSPAGSPAPEPSKSESREFERPEPQRETSLIPSEYDSYWNDQSAASPTSPSSPQQQQRAEVSDPQSYGETAAAAPTAPPKLKKRFSWELSSEDEEAEAEPEPASRIIAEGSDLGRSEQLAWAESNPARETMENERDLPVADMQPLEPLPLSRTQSPSPVGATGDQTDHPEAQQDVSTPHIVPSEVQPRGQGDQSSQGFKEPLSPSKVLPIDESKLLGFRDILGVQSASERIRLFEKTRHQFAALDSGLDSWIRRTAEILPEHTDLVEQNGIISADFHRSSTSRAKFSKLSSLGGLSSHLEGSQQSAGPGHVRRTSGAPLGSMIKRQHMEQRGKEFLHSAGVIGGKAGGAAKGLFAKGKSKFLSGATDKGSQSSSIRRSLQLPEMAFSPASDSDASHAHSSQRSSVALGGVPRLPSFRFHENQFAVKDVLNSGSRSAEVQRGPNRNIRSLSLDATGTFGGRLSPLANSVYRGGSIGNVGSIQENRAEADEERNTTLSTFQKIDPFAKDVAESQPASAMTATYSGVEESPTALWSAAVENPHDRQSVSSVESRADDHSETRLESKSAEGGASPASPSDQYLAASEQGRVSPMAAVNSVDLPSASQASDVNQDCNVISNDPPSTVVAEQRVTDGPTNPEAVPPDGNLRIDSDTKWSPDGENENAALQANDSPDDLTRVNAEGDKECLVEHHQAMPPEYSTGPEASDHEATDEPPPAFPAPDSPYPKEKQGSHRDAPASEATPSPRPAYRMISEHERSSVTGHDVFHLQSHARSADNVLHEMDTNAPPQKRSVSSLGIYDRSPELRQQPQSLPQMQESYRTRSLDSSSLLRPNRLFVSPENSRSPQLSPAHKAYLNDSNVLGTPRELPPDTFRASPVSNRSGFLPGQRRQSGDINPQAPPTRNSFISSARNSIFSALSKHDSESLRSRDSIPGNAARPHTDISRQQTPAILEPELKTDKGKSTKNKMKKLAKLHRSSLPATDSKPVEGAKRRTLARISGLFGFSSSAAQQSSAEGKRSSSRQSAAQPTPFGDNRTSENAGSGQSGGFIGGHRLEKQRSSNHDAPTGQYHAQNQPHTPPQSGQLYHPQPRHQQFAPTSSSILSARSPPPRNTFSPSYPVRREATPQERDRYYTQELRMRSRSPTSHPPKPDVRATSLSDPSDPAHNLGTFHSVPNTNRVGDQETPWNITLPGETQEDPRSSQKRSKLQRPAAFKSSYCAEPITSHHGQYYKGSAQQKQQATITPSAQHIHPALAEPSIAAKSTDTTAYDDIPDIPNTRRFSFEPESNVTTASRENRNQNIPRSTHPHRDESTVINRTAEPVELPLRQDDSSEEIVMSSTSYPGQEWQPAGYANCEY